MDLLINEEVTRRMFEDFYFVMTIAAFFSGKKLEYLMAELDQYPKAKEYFENLPVMFARETIKDLEPMILDEARQGKVGYDTSGLKVINYLVKLDKKQNTNGDYMLAFILANKSAIRNSKKSWYSIAYEILGKNDNIYSPFYNLGGEQMSIERAQTIIRTGKANTKNCELNRKVRKTLKEISDSKSKAKSNLELALEDFGFDLAYSKDKPKTDRYLELLVYWFGMNTGSVKKAQRFKPVIETIPFYNSDPLFSKKYIRSNLKIVRWNPQYGGAMWAIGAWLLKRLYMFVYEKERIGNNWLQVSLIANALMQIEHNTGSFLNKLDRYIEVWQAGLDLKTFATKLEHYENVSSLAKQIRYCAEKAAIEYSKHAAEPGTKPYEDPSMSTLRKGTERSDTERFFDEYMKEAKRMFVTYWPTTKKSTLQKALGVIRALSLPKLLRYGISKTFLYHIGLLSGSIYEIYSKSISPDMTQQIGNVLYGLSRPKNMKEIAKKAGVEIR